MGKQALAWLLQKMQLQIHLMQAPGCMSRVLALLVMGMAAEAAAGMIRCQSLAAVLDPLQTPAPTKRVISASLRPLTVMCKDLSHEEPNPRCVCSSSW